MLTKNTFNIYSLAAAIFIKYANITQRGKHGCFRTKATIPRAYSWNQKPTFKIIHSHGSFYQSKIKIFGQILNPNKRLIIPCKKAVHRSKAIWSETMQSHKKRVFNGSNKKALVWSSSENSDRLNTWINWFFLFFCVSRKTKKARVITNYRWVWMENFAINGRKSGFN